MTNPTRDFGNIAVRLSKNPLGIIALFIVLVYSVSSSLLGFGGSLTQQERLLLIYFLIGFPIIVLVVFAWLVSNHSHSLFGPGDFKNENNYIKMVAAGVSLTAATRKDHGTFQSGQLERIVETLQHTDPEVFSAQPRWKDEILWVDDNPDNNVYERQAFEAIGLHFTIATSTKEALAAVKSTRYAAIISDMGREEGPREGYRLLDQLRIQGDHTPFFLYTGSNAPEHKREAREHGAQGATNDPQEIFQMVTKAIIRAPMR